MYKKSSLHFRIYLYAMLRKFFSTDYFSKKYRLILYLDKHDQEKRLFLILLFQESLLMTAGKSKGLHINPLY